MQEVVITAAICFAVLTALRLVAAGATAAIRYGAAALKWVAQVRVLIVSILLAVFITSIKSPISDLYELFLTSFIEVIYMPSAPEAVLDEPNHYLLELNEQLKGDKATFDYVVASVQQTADTIGTYPAAIYAVALLECGLDPFKVRQDKVAAGWLQFTRMGVSNLGVTMKDVLRACHMRDIEFIMSLSHKYLTRHAARVGGALPSALDVYLAVFAPAKIGAAPDAVLYSGFDNPAYYKNKGLDGWFLDAQNRIVRGKRDGIITVNELYLCMLRRSVINKAKWDAATSI